MSLEILSSFDLSATVVIGSVVTLAVILISYLIYKIGFVEKSFEEVIEEQKRRSIEEELKQKSEKVKKEKKFKKTWGKKSKEKSESEIPSEPILETKDVATNIEIIEPKEVKPLKQSKKSKGTSNHSAENSQSLEKVKKSETSQVQEKTKKQESSPLREKVKKSEISTVLEKSVQEKKSTEAEKVIESPKVEVKETVPLPTTAAVQNNAAVQSVSQPSSNAQKKKKKEQIEKEAVPMTTSKLLTLIKQTDLETEEIQNLIDALLNKQKDSSGWTKVNDFVAVTKKNLQEKEQLLDLEQRQNQAVTSKLKDLREEYNAFRAKMSAQEKANQEKIARQQQDIQNLSIRVKQFQDQLQTEKEKNTKEVDASVKSLEEEKSKLLQKITKLETESRSGASSSEYEALKKSREDLQKVHALLVEQHTQLVSTHTSDMKNLQAQLSDAKSQAEKVNAQNAILSKDIQALKEFKSAAELAKRTIEDKLKAEEKRSAELNAQLQQIAIKSTELTQLQAELKELRLENERLTEQLVTTKERVAGDGQEIVHQNGELNGKSQIHEKPYDDKNKLLAEQEKLLAQLNDDLNKERSKTALYIEEIELQKQKNNELREKNWKAMEALTNAEKSAEQRIKEIQIAADQRIAQAEALNQNQVSDTIGEYSKIMEQQKQNQMTEADQVNERCEFLQQKIFSMEKKVAEIEHYSEKSQTTAQECLIRIFPSISIDSSLPYHEWLSEFEKEATIYIQSVVSQYSDTKVQLKEKELEYEKVLAETELTLLNLQKSAESQEVVWQERLKIKEKELQQVQAERDALAAEKVSMQSTFQQISQLEELQEKLKLLQNTLETAETERSHLEQKYDEVNKNYINLRDQLENKEKQIEELQKESTNLEPLKKEIEDLKSKLDKEKKISKDFSSQMIKLNSLVKIGQDALKQEQEMVASLKSQLEVSKVSTANGTASATKASPVTNNESRPKTKGSEKSKKRMDASDK